VAGVAHQQRGQFHVGPVVFDDQDGCHRALS
jgi:hypothetical protein